MFEFIKALRCIFCLISCSFCLRISYALRCFSATSNSCTFSSWLSISTKDLICSRLTFSFRLKFLKSYFSTFENKKQELENRTEQNKVTTNQPNQTKPNKQVHSYQSVNQPANQSNRESTAHPLKEMTSSNALIKLNLCVYTEASSVLSQTFVTRVTRSRFTSMSSMMSLTLDVTVTMYRSSTGKNRYLRTWDHHPFSTSLLSTHLLFIYSFIHLLIAIVVAMMIVIWKERVNMKKRKRKIQF